MQDNLLDGVNFDITQDECTVFLYREFVTFMMLTTLTTSKRETWRLGRSPRKDGIETNYRFAASLTYILLHRHHGPLQGNIIAGDCQLALHNMQSLCTGKQFFLSILAHNCVKWSIST